MAPAVELAGQSSYMGGVGNSTPVASNSPDLALWNPNSKPLPGPSVNSGPPTNYYSLSQDSGTLNQKKAIGQLILGNYSKNATVGGTILQIEAGLLGIDLPGDIRDIIYDATLWKTLLGIMDKPYWMQLEYYQV